MGGAVEPGATKEGDAHSSAGRTTKGRAVLRDFVEASGAKNIAAQITAIGAFVCEAEGKEEFTRDEVDGNFKGAGLAPPKNIHRDFQSALSKGWISEDRKSPGQYFITGKGEKALQNKFEGTRASSGRGPRKKNRKTAKPGKK
jgi:hypothetical protein